MTLCVIHPRVLREFMNETMSTMYDFQLERDAGALPRWLDSCARVELCESSHTFEVDLSGDHSLAMREIGRLIILNGKCRGQGFQLVLKCSPLIGEQMQQCRLNRIIWVENL
ncbi:MAG: hypothetical protein C4527_16295 [Candidatus Omnitrophota bacterium]|jgi:hypothetical protein|nr:MAG: hypothetical protein C4527_16295 [Candidatus Omnitrophota bacterium]